MDGFNIEKLKEANAKLNIYDDLSLEKNRNLIFVYCPPKVGSTTIVSSIRMSAFNKFTVLHIHDELMLKVVCGVENVTVNDIIKYNSSIGKNVYVIDIYRSPIEQKISKFFEKLSVYHLNNSPLLINNYDVNKVINRFNSLFPHILNEDYYKDTYGIPYPESFDYINKYLLQTINNIKYIKIRLKDSEEWKTILTNILGIEIIVIKDYETSDKPIKEMFMKFKNEYRIPSNFLKSIEECPTLRYYYSECEREEYLNLWRNKQSDFFTPYTEEENVFYNKISQENKYMNDIQRTHYLDEGCTCKACQIKRYNIISRIKNGEKVNEKIIHNDTKIEYINQKVRQTQVITVRRGPQNSVNQQKMKSTFGGSIARPGGKGLNIKF
uniref:Uncharacterized protein n=1 Tax=viral metagenome TaxID=1070528 RepID=A0A6C0KWI9_9ZZZZ